MAALVMVSETPQLDFSSICDHFHENIHIASDLVGSLWDLGWDWGCSCELALRSAMMSWSEKGAR